MRLAVQVNINIKSILEVNAGITGLCTHACSLVDWIQFFLNRPENKLNLGGQSKMAFDNLTVEEKAEDLAIEALFRPMKLFSSVLVFALSSWVSPWHGIHDGISGQDSQL